MTDRGYLSIAEALREKRDFCWLGTIESEREKLFFYWKQITDTLIKAMTDFFRGDI